MDDYYRHEIYPVLTPMVIDQARPFPLISDKTLNIGLLLKEKLDGDLVLQPFRFHLYYRDLLGYQVKRAFIIYY